MEQFLIFTERNLKLYFRDRGAIFFSLLTMIIVIMLMVFFLGDMNVEAIIKLLSVFPGRDPVVDEENAKHLVYIWTCAGVLAINALTVTVSVYSKMIRDRENGILNSFYTAPVSRVIITMSYVVAAWIAAIMVCVITLFVTELYGLTQGVPMYSLTQHLAILGSIVLNSFLYAAFMYCVALLVKSEGAWSGIGTVIGTLVGFLGAIYIPIGSLADSVQNILKCTPVIYSAALFRKVMTEQIIADTFTDVPEEMITGYSDAMGIDLSISEHLVSNMEICGLLLILGIIFVGIAVCILTHSKKSDR